MEVALDAHKQVPVHGTPSAHVLTHKSGAVFHVTGEFHP